MSILFGSVRDSGFWGNAEGSVIRLEDQPAGLSAPFAILHR